CMGAVLSGRRKKMKKLRVSKSEETSTSLSSFEEEESSLQSETDESSADDYETSQVNSSRETSASGTGTHSSDTSFGVLSLPEVEEYHNWRKDNAQDDEKWVANVKEFNRRWPVHRRITSPARLVRRLTVPKSRLGWAKAFKEVKKREYVEWEVDEDGETSHSECLAETLSPWTDSLDETTTEESEDSHA
ncbi:hypothetical protein PFISCL1PPCAC_23899, partial [Pristionchus fissidentatus]